MQLSNYEHAVVLRLGAGGRLHLEVFEAVQSMKKTFGFDIVCFVRHVV
jgi:hypothetical protein